MGAADPYSLLMLFVFNQAIMDITAYFGGTGNCTTRKSGREAVTWIKYMRGTFPWVAIAANEALEVFHQKSLNLVWEIKNSFIKSKATRIRVVHKL